MRDPLGDRIKNDYEWRTRVMLPRRTCTVVRLDGRAFHTYTRGLDRPFDVGFMEDMNETARFLCAELQGARLAYAQSDEVSVVLHDGVGPASQAWFDGNLQKIVSVSASLATARFNQLRWGRALEVAPPTERVRLTQVAAFDSRAFTISDPAEVVNYLIWRQHDATRNSIHTLARSRMSHAECVGKTNGELQELLWSRHRVNWNDCDERFKRGTQVIPVTTRGDVAYVDRRTGAPAVAEDVERHEWVAEAAPVFERARSLLVEHVPGYRWDPSPEPVRTEGEEIAL